MNKTLLTQSGYDKLSAEILTMKERQNRLITEIEEVAQPDESGEDGLATQLKEELEVLNAKITEIEEALEVAQIITDKPSQKTTIVVGSTVKVKISSKSEKQFSIVSHLESDPSQDKISDQSPLGQALIGKKLHDEVEVDAPIGKITYKIVSIN
jgi:transcription elongation factor GreA